MIPTLCAFVFLGNCFSQVTEPENKAETDKDGSVLDIGDANVILSFTEAEPSLADPNKVEIGIKMRSKTPLRGFQFMVASGEGNYSSYSLSVSTCLSFEGEKRGV